ncbi:hypothetical protein ACJX0J_030312, partial [Zea mays]
GEEAMRGEEAGAMEAADYGKLFVGGISWETSEDRLREYFGRFGEVTEAAIMRDRSTGRARGFGFVVFTDAAVAERVTMEKHMIDGRMVEAKKAVPRDDHSIVSKSNGRSTGSPGPGRTRKIFVGGLPSSITEADFRRYFEQFGVITDVVVMYDHNTQRPRGFGFITYDSSPIKKKALHKSFHELNGKMSPGPGGWKPYWATFQALDQGTLIHMGAALKALHLFNLYTSFMALPFNLSTAHVTYLIICTCIEHFIVTLQHSEFFLILFTTRLDIFILLVPLYDLTFHLMCESSIFSTSHAKFSFNILSVHAVPELLGSIVEKRDIPSDFLNIMYVYMNVDTFAPCALNLSWHNMVSL